MSEQRSLCGNRPNEDGFSVTAIAACRLPDDVNVTTNSELMTLTVRRWTGPGTVKTMATWPPKAFAPLSLRCAQRRLEAILFLLHLLHHLFGATPIVQL